MNNHKVFLAIQKALKELGLEDLGGGDETFNGQNAIGNDYRKGDYKVKIIIAN